MKKIIIITAFCFSILFTSFSQDVLQPGTPVFAEWSENSWYHGKIEGPCDKGFMILYDDGDTKCCSRDEIVIDVVPAQSELSEGNAVLAQWGSERFYPGKLGPGRGGRYKIFYDDGDNGICTIEQIRVRSFLPDKPVSAPAAAVVGPEPVLEQAMEIWKGGSSWAVISEDGTIWIEGSIDGEIEADGDIFVHGSNVGVITYDGEIYKEGSHVGDMEMNCYFWRGGSKIGEIAPNGGIWLQGSKCGEISGVGSVDYGEMKVAAAVLAFFTEDFGF